MLQIETLVGMTETMLADEDFIETFASRGSKVSRRNCIKEYAAEAGTPLQTTVERESVRLLLEHTLSAAESKHAAYTLAQALAEQSKAS